MIGTSPHEPLLLQSIGRTYPSASPLSFAFVLCPSFPVMSLAGIVESLRHAGEHGDARWEFIGAAGSRTNSSSGICMDATAPYADPDAFDFVFVIGGLLCDLAEAP